MKATKPQFLPRLRWSSSRGHMIFTLAMSPKRPNSRFSTCHTPQQSSNQRAAFPFTKIASKLQPHPS